MEKCRYVIVIYVVVKITGHSVIVIIIDSLTNKNNSNIIEDTKCNIKHES